MARTPEYQEFLDSVGGRKPDTLPADLETTATPEEIGWWKQHQICRAINHARYGVATPIELHLLKIHDIPLPNRAKSRTEATED